MVVGARRGVVQGEGKVVEEEEEEEKGRRERLTRGERRRGGRCRSGGEFSIGRGETKRRRGGALWIEGR